MRSIEKIEANIAKVRHEIKSKTRLNTIAKFAGADELTSLFAETKAFYEQAIRSLDENNPALNKEYAKNKACLVLVEGFISGMGTADTDLIKLNQALLDLHGELEKAQEEVRRREKAAF